MRRQQPRKPTYLPPTLASAVLLQGQRYRADETPTRMAITVRFLAERQVARQARRETFRRAVAAR